jgi:hypothetical protein
MKKKIPLLNVWLVTDRRLQAGYRHRYEKGHREGFRAGFNRLARETQTEGLDEASRARRKIA